MKEYKGDEFKVLAPDMSGYIIEMDYEDALILLDELGANAERTCKMETDHAELEAIASSHEDTWAYKCSACDWSFRYDRGIKLNYCPNCGLKVIEV